MDHPMNPLRLNGDPPPNQGQGGAMVQVEQQKAIAEVQARIIVARRFPRDPVQAVNLILQDCERMTVAENAQYVFARGGTEIKGASIDLITAIARRWGNCHSGIKELSRGVGYSECVAYATDYETNFTDERVFQVRHWRDTRSGGYALKDERDINELIANQGQRRKRACLEAILPPDVVEAAVAKCDDTVRTRADLSPENVGRMVKSFAEIGVTKAQIEARIQRAIEAIEAAQFVSLKRIYKAIRDGISTAAELFPHAAGDPPAGDDPAAPATVADRAKAAMRKGKAGKAEPTQDSASAPPAPPAPPAEENAATGQDEASAGPTGEQLREQLMKATDRDAAIVVIDRARHLAKPDYDALVDLFEQRFPE